jgi:hypothetical protein
MRHLRPLQTPQSKLRDVARGNRSEPTPAKVQDSKLPRTHIAALSRKRLGGPAARAGEAMPCRALQYLARRQGVLARCERPSDHLRSSHKVSAGVEDPKVFASMDAEGSRDSPEQTATRTAQPGGRLPKQLSGSSKPLLCIPRPPQAASVG